MPLLNPANIPLTPLTFTAAGQGTTTDALGNPVRASRTVTVQAIVTPLGSNRLTEIAGAIGVPPAGIPVKVRVESWPVAVRGQRPAVASLTYGGRPATITLAPIRDQHPTTAATVPDLGQHCEGVLVYA